MFFHSRQEKKGVDLHVWLRMGASADRIACASCSVLEGNGARARLCVMSACQSAVAARGNINIITT
jgi:hypothetical protein